MRGGVEAADSCMANLPLLTPLLNFKPVGFFGLCVCVVFRGFSFWGFVLFLFLYLWHLDNHRKYVRKGLYQLELDMETKTKFQLGLIFPFGYFKTRRESLQLSSVTKRENFFCNSYKPQRGFNLYIFFHSSRL